MSDYRRTYTPGGTLFFTVNLKNRQSDLLVHHIQRLRDSIKSSIGKKPFTIDAWVVLPEHMHCIWTLPEGDSDYSRRWREIKKSFTLRVGEGSIWQPRFWEHTIRNEADYHRHLDYIYINPVKHGWVNRVQDWPYSTFHRDVRRGMYPLDWAGEAENFDVGERR